MGKTLSRKTINGHDYYYLVWREEGKLRTEYLGGEDSPKFRNYLLGMAGEERDEMFKRARRECFEAGTSVVSAEENSIVREYRNGHREKVERRGI